MFISGKRRRKRTSPLKLLPACGLGGVRLRGEMEGQQTRDGRPLRQRF